MGLLRSIVYPLKVLHLIIPHLCLLYCCIQILMNTSLTMPIFHATVNPLFSGGIYWEKLEFGPTPWQLKIIEPKLRTADQKIVVEAKMMSIDRFDYTSLWQDGVKGSGIHLVDVKVDLEERDSLIFGEPLWNIAELFFPLENQIDDGELSTPMDLDFREIDIENADIHLKMPVIELDAKNLSLKNAFFHFLVDEKKMYMGATESKVDHGIVDIFILDDSSTAQTAQPPPVIHYELADLKIDQFFWRDQDFGASAIQLKSFQTDTLEAQNLMMSMIKGATPHMYMDFKSNLQNTGRYLKTWDLDQKIDGSVVANGHLFGPVSNFKGHIQAVGNFKRLFDIPIKHYDLIFDKFADDLIQIQKLDLKQESGALEIDGHYHLYKLDGVLNIKVQNGEWSKWLPPKTLQQLKPYQDWIKPINGRIQVQTYAKPEQVDLIPQLLISAQLESKTPQILSVDSLFRLENGKLWVDQNNVHLGQNQSRLLSLKTKGDLDLNPLSINLSNDLQFNLDPHQNQQKIPIKLPIKGKLNAKALLKGPAQALKYNVELEAKNLEILLLSSLKIDTIQAKANGDFEQIKLKTNGEILDGRFEASIQYQFKNPDEFKGWYYVDQLDIRLAELLPDFKKEDLPFKTKLSSMGCALFDGCEAFYEEKKELVQKFDTHGCISSSKRKIEKPKEFDPQIHFCTKLDQPKYLDLILDYFDLSYQWYKGTFFLEHAFLVKGDKKLFDAKAIIDFKNQHINALIANVNKFPLHLVQLFVPNPPLIVKTLQGSMKASLDAKGKFNQIYAESSINLKKVNFQVAKGDDTFNIGLGKTDLLLKLKDDRLAVTGNFAKIFELEADFPIKKTPEIKLGELQLKINNLSTSYLRAIPVNEESYLNEYKVLSTLVQNEIDFAPIPLMDATEGLNFLGLGKAFYCTTQSLALANGQLAHLLLDGMVRLKFDTFFRVNPIISTSFNQFELDYWMRGDEGQLIQLPNTPPCASLCQNDVYMCPTISIRNRDLIQFEMLKHKDQLLAYFNPTQSMVNNADNTNTINEAQVASIENCNHFQTDGLKAPSFIPKTEIKAMPIILEGSSQNFIFGGYVYGDQINACTNASFELGVAYPFLNHIYQQLEGQSEILTAIYGKVSAPQVEGFLKLKEMNLLSPRSQVTGEIRLIDPLQLQISPLEEGGFFTSLPPKQEVSFNWDDGEIKIKGFQLKFPDFKFKQLLLDFSANQVELNLPEMVRLSAQLQDMRFEFLKNGTLLSDQRMSLSGDIELLRGVYKANIQGANELNEGFRNNLSGRSKVQTLSIFERSPILKRLFLNLRLRGENDFFIRNQVAILQLNLEISMDLRIKGYLYTLESDLLSEQLRLSGELKTLTGSKITYANRPFDVVDGIIRFGDGLHTGQTGNFLNANLEATHTFRIPKTAMRGRQLTVDQSNTGEMIEEEVTLKTKFEMASKNAKPLIDFSLSSPSGASKLELATLVLTGRFPSKVNTATTSAQPATEVLLSPLLNLIERPIEDTLNLDLSLTPDTSGMLFVDLNKIFSRRLRLYARTPIGDDQKTNPQIFSLEYRFNNLIYGEISNDRINQVSSTSSRFRLRLSWENF